MLRFVTTFFKTRGTTIPKSVLVAEDATLVEIGEKIHEKVRVLFHGSLAIRQVDAGSDNACEQELTALTNSYYDCERFGIHFVASPRHADMLLVSGPVTRNMQEALRRAYRAMPTPNMVVAVGDDALDGGMWKGSYAVVGGVGDAGIPVHYHIPGDPPSPKTILHHLLMILTQEECARAVLHR